ncbi:MAG TPA: cysteine desulfurase family protein [Pirellulaceae bacterium]|nr:cysteine desulfurase family protein [Pirellulaceae bacterium]
MRRIYLDYNATTPIAPSVREAMLPFLGEHFGNPSSSHALGRACLEAVEDARGQVASLLGADAEEIVFTGCGSESNNLALKGLLLRGGRSGGGHLVISAIEHPSVVETARFLERLGCDVSIVPVTGQGVVQPEAVRKALRDDTVLVSIMHANNEIGTIQPLVSIAETCHEAGVLLHTDAAQSAGKIRTQVDELQVDLLTIAGHKLYAPKGVGALFVRQGIDLEPLVHGGGQESGLRSGTENVASIIGLGAAASLAAKSLDAAQERLAQLRDRLLAALREGIGEGLIVHGQHAPRLPNTLAVSFPAASGYDLLARVPELCASTGSACHSGAQHISPTLAALGASADAARGTIRLSLGWYTSEEEIERAASLLIGAWEAVRE